MLDQFGRGGPATTVLILDACRNIPEAMVDRQTAPGLAYVLAPSGSYIAYSTAPGMVAADGAGTLSPFAGALVEELARPQKPIEDVFRSVRRSVLQTTGGTQTPWDSSSLVDPFYFRA